MADEAAASHEEADKHKNLSITVVSCHCCIAPVCLFNLVGHSFDIFLLLTKEPERRANPKQKLFEVCNMPSARMDLYRH